MQVMRIIRKKVEKLNLVENKEIQKMTEKARDKKRQQNAVYDCGATHRKMSAAR